MAFRIGIDVGGTFTDFLLMGPGVRSAAHKELSTPADPSLAVMSGLGALAKGEAMPLAQQVAHFLLDRRDIATVLHLDRDRADAAALHLLAAEHALACGDR